MVSAVAVMPRFKSHPTGPNPFDNIPLIPYALSPKLPLLIGKGRINPNFNPISAPSNPRSASAMACNRILFQHPFCRSRHASADSCRCRIFPEIASGFSSNVPCVTVPASSVANGQPPLPVKPTCTMKEKRPTYTKFRTILLPPLLKCGMIIYFVLHR